MNERFKLKIIDFGLLAFSQSIPMREYNFYKKFLPQDPTQNETFIFFSGYARNINADFYDSIYYPYPLYAFFVGKERLLKIKEKKVKSIILNHVTNYMNNSWVQYTIKAFYKYLGIWNIDHLCKIMYEFFKLLSEDTIDENYYLMVQSIDLFSWGIMLLQYANKIKDLCDRGVIDISLYSDVHKNIYKFLKDHSILNPLPIKIGYKKKYFFSKKKEIYTLSIDTLKVDNIIRKFEIFCQTNINNLKKNIKNQRGHIDYEIFK